MEFEKTLFRVHEKILSSKVAKKSCHLCFYLCSLIGISFLVLGCSNYASFNHPSAFYLCQYSIQRSQCLPLPTCRKLQSQYPANPIFPYAYLQIADQNPPIANLLKTDSIAYIQIVSLSQAQIDDRVKNNKTINESEILQFFQFSGNYQLLNMNSTIR